MDACLIIAHSPLLQLPSRVLVQPSRLAVHSGPACRCSIAAQSHDKCVCHCWLLLLLLRPVETTTLLRLSRPSSLLLCTALLRSRYRHDGASSQQYCHFWCLSAPGSHRKQ